MKDKKSFGMFIAEKRKEHNLTQAELAEKLYVSKTAVSKWERGVTYPDITLISDLCAVLDVDEHELVAEGSTSEYRKIRADAKKYKTISDIYFYGLCGAYAIALIVCFICNLAADKTLSWFFIVFAALLTAFTLFPSIVRFVDKYKLLTVVGSFTVALSLLLLTCNIYSGGSWFFIAITSVILGLTSLFLPIFVRIYPLPDVIKRHAPIMYVATEFILLLILLVFCLYSNLQVLGKAVLMSLYLYAPVIVCVLTFSYLNINNFFKSAIACAICSVTMTFVDAVASKLFNYEYKFNVDLLSWGIENIDGNVLTLVLFTSLLAAAILTIIGIFKVKNK